MVHVKKLELRGFKSFGNFKTSVSFDPRFTCIVGKNGSGKSTIIEALLFVIGEMSAKYMRAERFSDLLFSGGNGFKPASSAEVALTLDNSDRGLPLPDKEVIIARKLDRDGRCIYLINGKRVSRQEVLDLLASSQFSLGDYSFILQGEVSSLAAMSPIERRQLIDEIAGVSEFDEKKAKAVEELKKVESNLQLQRVQLEQVEKRLHELEEDLQKIERYESLQREISKLESWKSGLEYRKCQLSLRTIASQLGKLQKEKRELESKIASVENKKSKLKRERDRLERLISEQQKSLGLENFYTLKGKLDMLSRQLQDELDRGKRLQARLREAEGRWVRFQELLSKFRRLRAELKPADPRVAMKVLKKIEHVLREIEELLCASPLPAPSTTAVELSEVNSRIEELRRQLKQKEEQFQRVRKKVKEGRRRLKQIESLRETLGNKIRGLESLHSRLQQQRAQLDLRIASLREEKGRLEERIKNLKRANIPRGITPSQIESKLRKLKLEQDRLGEINFKARQSYRSCRAEYEKLSQKYQKQQKEKERIERAIQEIEQKKKEVFMNLFHRISRAFSEIFQRLQPEGEAKLILQNPENPFEGGLEMRARFVKGGLMRDVFSISGGEKALVVLSFIFALQQVKPSALYVFDEVDASLDPINVRRVAELLKEYSRNSQLIVVSFRTPVMEAANRLVGVYKEGGVSQVRILDPSAFEGD